MEEVLQAIARHSNNTRVFTLGVDTASQGLVKGMADAGAL